MKGEELFGVKIGPKERQIWAKTQICRSFFWNLLLFSIILQAANAGGACTLE
ncbi:MAG: hypothetical protein II949_07025 [Prevotella sp.]|nr:hypothetical protein [Prevotella sp.]